MKALKRFRVMVLALTNLALLAHAEERFHSNLLPSVPVFSVASVTPAQIADARAYRNWKLSLVPVFASQALDVTSSYGMRELNPMLADSSGRFGAQGAAIKLGTTAAIAAVEYFIVRKHPQAARVFSKLNWAGSAVTAGLAVHNYSIR